MSDALWDDEGFRKRVRQAAQRKGITVNQALEMAGVSAYYLKKPVQGRSTNTVLNLARVLDVPPAEMFGLAVAGETPVQETPELASIDGDQLRRITVVTQMMAAQLAALVYVASSRSDIDPAALMELVMRKLNDTQQSSAESGGNKE